MLDRLVGIAGLVLGLVALVAPYRWPNVPGWLTTSVLCAAMILVGISVHMIFGRPPERAVDAEASARDTSLFLQFSDSHSVPKEIRQSNVLSWYALYTESIYVETLDANKTPLGGFQVPPRWSVFVLFEKPTVYRQMIATCTGPNGPKCDVQCSNARYAIVTVVGDVSMATLDLAARD